ncbi:MAG: dihydrodipicolinate synthase family protein [Rhizobiaceae bacterium]
MFGVSAALTTPFKVDGLIDFDCLNDHIKTVLSEGCDSVTFFGTTGEGASIACEMRLAAISAAIDAEIDPAKIILTLHGAAADDIVLQANTALQLGVEKFLLPPPCYFGGLEDQGLFDWFSHVLSKFQGTDAKFILYHIPQVIGVGLPIEMVAQLKSAFPEIVLGVKDSSGSFENTKNLLQLEGLEILVGDERLLADAVRLGASGAISGIANLFSERLSQMVSNGKDDPAINKLVDTVLQFPVTAAIKTLVAHKYQTNDWRRATPPLVTISDTDCQTLKSAYDLVGAP